jgi:hypothetical protein
LGQKTFPIGDLAARSGRFDAVDLRQISSGQSTRAGAKERVRGGAAGPLAVDLGLTAGDFRLKHVDPLFQLGDAEQLKVLTNRLDEALAAANADFRRLFHDGLYLSGSPMGRYPTAHATEVQVCATLALTAFLEPST